MARKKTEKNMDAKTPNTKKYAENGVRVVFRLYDQNEILRFKKWQRELESQNKSVSQELSIILMNYLNQLDKKLVMRDLKEDMFYAFRKALYASMYPFTNTLKTTVEKYEVETILANQKIDILLNILANNKIEFNEQLLNRPDDKLLNESIYFQQMRNVFNKQLEKEIEAEQKKALEVAKSFEKYANYEFDGRMDSNIENNDEEIS
ncbi:Mbov_0398 family ICE element protein [Mycoplasmopsis bovigenitalium]|nr:hypothetical protein [Mycoplasmopsis bovigenitalium]